FLLITTTSCSFSVCFLYYYVALRDLHSFPTRRSSDLRWNWCLKKSCSLVGLLPAPALRRLRRSFAGPRHSRPGCRGARVRLRGPDRKSTRLNSSHVSISYAVFCLKKKKKKTIHQSLLQ